MKLGTQRQVEFKSVLGICILTILTSYVSGCASFSEMEKGRFKSATLHNLNPAPERFAPPDKIAEADLVDPVYLRTQADYHYSLGEAFSLEGDSLKAIEEFKLTLVYDPQSVAVRLRLAAEFVKQGLMSESIEQAEAAVGLDPSSLDGRILLGGLYSSLKMYDLAHKQYSYLQIQYPENLDVPVYIGALYAEEGRYNEAERTFRLLAQNSNNEDKYKAYYYIGRIRFEEGGEANYKKAEKAFLKSIGLKPEEEDTVMALSRLYKKMGKNKQSLSILASYQEKFGPKRFVAKTLSLKYLEVENYEKALEQLEIIEGYEPENLNIKVKIALILIEQKKYTPAISKLEEILRSAPESDKIRFYLGAVYEEIKNPSSAIYHFTKIQETSAYFQEAVVHSAYLYKSMGKYSEAVEVIVSGIQKKPEVPQFYAFYASLLDESKEYKKAIVMLNDAVKKFPQHTQLRFFLGSMHDRLGNFKQTIENMQKVIEIDQNHTQALNYLAYTYAENNMNLLEAEELALRALGLNPDDGYVLDTVGWVMFKQGRMAEAIKYLEAAHKNISTESIIAEHLGDVYYRLELIDKAKKMYVKAVSIAKDEERIREIRTKISVLKNQKEIRKPASVQSN